MLARVIAAFLLISPLAMAGGLHVDVAYFDESESCDSSYVSDGAFEEREDGYSYWSTSSSASSCERSHTTVGTSASDDQGELAGARLGGDERHADRLDQNAQGDAWSNNESEGSSHSDHLEQQSSSSERDGAEARAVGQRAHVGTVCATQGAEHITGSSSSTTTPDGSSSAHETTFAHGYTSRCATGVDATVVDRSAFVGTSDGCSNSAQATRRGWSDSFTSADEFGSSYQEPCHNGAEARAGDLGAAAGFRRACEGDTRRTSWEPGSRETFQRSWCRDGVGAEGPDGMQAFAGTEYGAAEGCFDDECWFESDRLIVAFTKWDNSPFGVANKYVILPYPVLP